jgi:hypothetical protein
MKFFKRALSAAAVSALLASSVAAAEVSPLPAGKPAGTRQADLIGTPFLLLGLGALAIIIAVAVSSSDKNNPTTPTTGTGG